jgi:hypothetical protein
LRKACKMEQKTCILHGNTKSLEFVVYILSLYISAAHYSIICIKNFPFHPFFLIKKNLSYSSTLPTISEHNLGIQYNCVWRSFFCKKKIWRKVCIGWSQIVSSLICIKQSDKYTTITYATPLYILYIIESIQYMMYCRVYGICCTVEYTVYVVL